RNAALHRASDNERGHSGSRHVADAGDETQETIQAHLPGADPDGFIHQPRQPFDERIFLNVLPWSPSCHLFLGVVMKMNFLLPNLICLLALLLVLITAAYSQNTGTSPQPGTTSQSGNPAQTPTQPTQTPAQPTQTPAQGVQAPSQTPSTLSGETQTTPPQPAF